LATLTAATGVNLTVHSSLTDDPPDLGEMALPDISAWSVLNYIQSHYPEGTHWQKTDDGYELTPAVIPVADDPPPNNPTGKALAAVMLFLVAALAGSAMFVVLRRSRQRGSPQRASA